jgi:FtsP/CotA-like multicopper oxidase with cupredoxin domain
MALRANVTSGSLTRRRLLGTGLAMAAIPLGRRAHAQPLPVGDFRLLRAGQMPHPAHGGGPATPELGFDGAVPGPILRARRGEELRIRLVNELSEPTLLHWHGVRLPNAMDGAAPLTQPAVAPGAHFDYRFTPRDAGTYWYHAATAQAGRGLAGVLIVEELQPPEIDRDLVLLFQDWPAANPGGIEILVANGRAPLDLPLETARRVRLRLVNASSRYLAPVRIGAPRVWVMAIDGQPAEPFLARDSQIALAPGNRADLFVDVGGADIAVGVGNSAPIARLVGGRSEPLADPTPLPANPLPERMEFRSAVRLDIPLEQAPRADVTTALAHIRLGRTVTIAFANRSDFAQAVHLHGHPMRLLDRLDDGWKPYWLDTVLVPPRATIRVAFVADNPGKWLLELRRLAAPNVPISGASDSLGWLEVT